MSNDSISRDLVGYGASPPKVVWPNGSRVAVSLVVNFEEGSESQVGDGDDHSERVGEVLSVVESSKRDYGQEQIFAYGMRVGLWRFLDCLSHHSLPATFYFCGKAIQRAPDNARAVVEAGCEAACHGWRWRPHSDYNNREEEKIDLIKCVDTMHSIIGNKPTGFFCRGSESPWTRTLLEELDFSYTSNAFDDDLPYYDTNGFMVLPYNLDTNDMKFFHPNGFATAQEMIDYVKDAVAQLLDEAKQGKSSTLSIGYHLRISGRPARFRAFSEIVSFLEGLGDQVWVAQRDQIAASFRNQYPLSPQAD
ncbi:MAG: polysaccharide deacetylase family protein [Granulosicoccus sp.]